MTVRFHTPVPECIAAWLLSPKQDEPLVLINRVDSLRYWLLTRLRVDAIEGKLRPVVGMNEGLLVAVRLVVL